MNEMIEDVAKAIWAERVRYAAENGIELGPFEVGGEPNNIHGEARAAIEVMRRQFGEGAIWEMAPLPAEAY